MSELKLRPPKFKAACAAGQPKGWPLQLGRAEARPYNSSTTSEITVGVREVQVHHRETQNHDHEIEDAEPGGSGAAPGGCARELEVGGIEREYEERYHVLGIVIPILAGEAVDPDKTENGAHGDGEEADEHAGAAHAFEEV